MTAGHGRRDVPLARRVGRGVIVANDVVAVATAARSAAQGRGVWLGGGGGSAAQLVYRRTETTVW